MSRRSLLAPDGRESRPPWAGPGHGGPAAGRCLPSPAWAAIPPLLAGCLLGATAHCHAASEAVAVGVLPRPELVVCSDPSNLPFSNQCEEGFENRIASLLAADLHRDLRYTWNLQRRSFLRRTLFARACDVVMGAPVGLPRVSTTRPYYASSYVFVTARGRHAAVHGFDDPALREWTIGLPALGADGANTPPVQSLAARGIVDHIVGFPMWGEADDETPPRRMIDAVASGAIDTAIVWGPFAGYFARGHGGSLRLTAVDPDPRLPAQTFSYAIALAVRPGDDELRDALQAALDRHETEIGEILAEFGIPRVDPLPNASAPVRP